MRFSNISLLYVLALLVAFTYSLPKHGGDDDNSGSGKGSGGDDNSGSGKGNGGGDDNGGGGNDDNGGGEAGGGGGTNGDFAVTLNGQVFNPAPGDEIKLDKQNTPVSGKVLFRGTFVEFDFNIANFAVENLLTGAIAPDRLVSKRTTIFTSKTPTLTSAQLASPRMTRLEVRDERVVLIIDTNGGSFKIQAQDTTQGGTLQTEPEFGQSSIDFKHVLANGIFFFMNEFTGKVNFGDGKDAVPQSQDPNNFHNMLLGKESIEAATQTFQSGTESRWTVQSGGRVASVFGEDAIELSPGSDQCTSQCQNRDMIHGSVPVTPDPSNPTPLPGVNVESSATTGVPISFVKLSVLASLITGFWNVM